MNIKRGKKIESAIPVSSMADIAFLLLIFLIVTSAINMQREQPITLPSATDSELVEDAHKCFVWVNADGRIVINNDVITPDDVEMAILKQRALHPDLVILLHGDENSPYMLISDILDRIKNAGVQKVIFVARRKTEK